MTRDGTTSLPLHAGTYAVLLVLLAVVSWLGRGWGYFVLYALVLLTFALVVLAGFIWFARGSSHKRTPRRIHFLARFFRSFAKAQITLGLVLLATAIVARSASGPLGPFSGGRFEGTPSELAFHDGFTIEGDEVQIQISSDPPYTITTHAFMISEALYVGADFVFPFKRWVHIVRDRPDVVLRVDGQLFKRTAIYIHDPDQSRRVLEEVSRQRGVDPDDWLTDVWFFRMEVPS